jgi:FkbM family methyltransferase
LPFWESTVVIKTIVKRVVHTAGFELRRIRYEHEDDLARRAFEYSTRYARFLSKSGCLQDMFVLAALSAKQRGFFVEFGASDGITLSNTFMLEKELGWSGILCEPNRSFAPQLLANRPACAVDNRCVWSLTGETISFTECGEGEISTATQFAQSDFYDRSKGSIEYQVETVSLGDLLAQYKAPAQIDYLSIDTEGSELTILNALDFNQWQFSAITVEHNWVQSKRNGIYSLLTSHGYTRVLTECSHCEDWYIKT